VEVRCFSSSFYFRKGKSACFLLQDLREKVSDLQMKRLAILDLILNLAGATLTHLYSGNRDVFHLNH